MNWIMKIIFFVIFALEIITSSMSQTNIFDWQGHRGCRGIMPENTIPAFKKALDIGVNTLEMDVVISKDGKVVVSHEPYFNPAISTTPDGKTIPDNTKINMYELPYADIKKYDVGSKGNPNFPDQQKVSTYKPLLSEVLETMESYRKTHNLPVFNYNIEIKSEEKEYDLSQPNPALFSDLVHEIIANIDPQRITIQSFDFNVLKHWHQQISTRKYKPVALAALVSNMKGVEKNLAELGFAPAIYSPYYQLINADIVKKLHAQNIRVIPWTINTTEEMIRVKAMGVDGIITDYPNRIPK